MTPVYIIIGIIVLCVGIGIQRLVVFLNRKQAKDIKQRYGQYFDFDISSVEHSISSFAERLYPVFDMSGKDVLWALSDDYYPCVVVYDKTQMFVCDVELRNGDIHQRNNRTETIDLSPSCINIVWLFRSSEVKPVYEVDVLYTKDGIKKELKLIRFGWDIDGSMNYHKFRNFVNAIKMRCQENNLSIHDVIRPS